MNKVIDEGFRSCRFVSTIVRHPVYKWRISIFIPSVAYLKCTPSDKQMYPQGYMYPRLGSPVVEWTRRGSSIAAGCFPVS